MINLIDDFNLGLSCYTNNLYSISRKLGLHTFTSRFFYSINRCVSLDFTNSIVMNSNFNNFVVPLIHYLSEKFNSKFYICLNYKYYLLLQYKLNYNTIHSSCIILYIYLSLLIQGIISKNSYKKFFKRLIYDPSIFYNNFSYKRYGYIVNRRIKNPKLRKRFVKLKG